MMQQINSTRERMDLIRIRLTGGDKAGKIRTDLNCSWRLVRVVRSNMAIERRNVE